MSVTLEVRKLLEKADHALEVAEELTSKGDGSFCLFF